MLPISIGNRYASYRFYETIKYNVASGGIVPVQSGEILSIGKPVSDSWLSTDARGDEVAYAASKANDGIQTDEDNYFKLNFAPFWWQVDFQTNASISQIHMATKMIKYSETYCEYTIMGSWDGSYYIQLVYGSTNTAVGFVRNRISNPYKSRYIKVNVYMVVNIEHGNEVDRARGIDESTIYATT